MVDTIEGFFGLNVKRISANTLLSLVLQLGRRAPGWKRRLAKALATEDKSVGGKYFPWIVATQQPMLYIMRNKY